MGLVVPSLATVQVNYSGKYSLQRLQALNTYCKQTSPLRVLLVCCAMPLPALVFVLVVECVPLEAPEKGWRANYMMWLCFLVTNIVMAQSLIAEGRGLSRSYLSRCACRS